MPLDLMPPTPLLMTISATSILTIISNQHQAYQNPILTIQGRTSFLKRSTLPLYAHAHTHTSLHTTPMNPLASPSLPLKNVLIPAVSNKSPFRSKSLALQSAPHRACQPPPRRKYALVRRYNGHCCEIVYLLDM